MFLSDYDDLFHAKMIFIVTRWRHFSYTHHKHEHVFNISIFHAIFCIRSTATAAWEHSHFAYLFCLTKTFFFVNYQYASVNKRISSNDFCSFFTLTNRKYNLRKVMVNGDVPLKVKKDAHALILEFIRSRPPLKKVCTQ